MSTFGQYGLEGLYDVFPRPCLQFPECNPVFWLYTVRYLTYPSLLLPITMNEDTGKLSCS